MNKVEFQQKLEEGNSYIERNEYEKAVEFFDLLNLDSVRDPRLLQNIAKAYEKCRRYDDAEDLLLQARECAPKSRGAVFHLCTLAIKSGNLDDAMKYYNDFCEIAKYDSERFILQYRIAKAKNKSDEELIDILEKFKVEEPDDKWMYELAKLYATNGRNQEALELCDEIILWFYNGKYVSMAKEMRSYLTGEPIEEEEEPAEDEESVVQVVTTRNLRDLGSEGQEASEETGNEETGTDASLLSEETEETGSDAEAEPAAEETPEEIENAAEETPEEFENVAQGTPEETDHPWRSSAEESETGSEEAENPAWITEVVSEEANENTEDQITEAPFDEAPVEPENVEAEDHAGKPEEETWEIAEVREAVNGNPEKEPIRAAKEPVFAGLDRFEERLRKASEELENTSTESPFPNQQVFVMDVRTGQLEIEAAKDRALDSAAAANKENLKEVDALLKSTTAELAAKQEELQQCEEKLAGLRLKVQEARDTLHTLENSVMDAVKRREAAEEAISRLQEKRERAEADMRTAVERFERAERNAREAEEIADRKQQEAAEILRAEAERLAIEEEARKVAEEETRRKAEEEEAARIAEEARKAEEEAMNVVVITTDEHADDISNAAEAAAEETAGEIETAAEETAEKAAEAAKDAAETVQTVAEETAETAAEAAKDASETVQTVTEETAESAEAATEEAVETAQTASEEVVETVEAVAEEIAETNASAEETAEEAAEEVAKKNPRFVFDLNDTVEEKTEEPAPAEEAQQEEPEETSDEEPENVSEEPEEIPEETADTTEEFSEESAKEEIPAEESEQSELEIYRTLQERISDRFNGLPSEPAVTADLWNVIVYGDFEEAILNRAKALMHEIEEVRGTELGKIVKISATKLAGVNMKDVIDQFTGRKVIVEDVAYLTDDQVIDFTASLKEKQTACMVCFTDTLQRLVELSDRVPMVSTAFTGIFNGNTPTEAELLNAVKKYLDEQDAVLTPEAEGLFLSHIDREIAENGGGAREKIMHLAERSLHNAEHSGLFGMFTGHIDDDGFLHVALKHVKKAEEE